MLMWACLESAVAIFGQAVLVGGTPTGKIDVVHLGNETPQGSWRDPDLFAVVGCSGGVNVKASQNLVDGFVYAKNNLDGPSKPFLF